MSTTSELFGTDLRDAVLAEWNKGRLSMSEVGAIVGKPRTTIARVLFAARRAGMFVVSIDPVDAARRRSKAARKLLQNPERVEILSSNLVMARAALASKRHRTFAEYWEDPR